MSIFSVLVDSFSAYNEKRARILVARELSNMPARELADLGFDSVLVAQGAKGWPWRVESKNELESLKIIWSKDNSVKTKGGRDNAVNQKNINSEQNAELQMTQAA